MGSDTQPFSFTVENQRSSHLYRHETALNRIALQNRFKSILCREDVYLLELVRYIHLNLIRAGLVSDLWALEKYPYSGHRVLMENSNRTWQNTDKVLKLFSNNFRSARRSYLQFVDKGIDQGKRTDLTGRGLIRSMRDGLL
jgi:putative transposase